MVDAEGKTLGHLSTEIARRFVVLSQNIPCMLIPGIILVVNAEKVRVTGNKASIKCIIVIAEHSWRH